MPGSIRVLLVDDHALIREGLRSHLGPERGVCVVGEAATASEGAALAAELMPNVAVIDIGLPDRSGLDLAVELLERDPALRVVLLTMHEDEEYVRRAVEVGLHGYVLKDMPPEMVFEAVTAVANGDVFFPPEVSRIALRDASERRRRERLAAALTPRERQVLVLLAQGSVNKEIAAELGLSVRTVETYRERIMAKLNIHTVAGLTRYAIAEGLVAAR